MIFLLKLINLNSMINIDNNSIHVPIESFDIFMTILGLTRTHEQSLSSSPCTMQTLISSALSRSCWRLRPQVSTERASKKFLYNVMWNLHNIFYQELSSSTVSFRACVFTSRPVASTSLSWLLKSSTFSLSSITCLFR